MKISHLFAALAAVCVVLPSAVSAQERSAVRAGFAFPTDHPVNIVVYRPEVHVGTLTSGGLDEANADWTATARGLIADALKANDKVAGAKLIFADEPEGDDGVYFAEYRALFSAVAEAIQVHKLFPGNRLPTKKETFDWTLGDGAARLGKMAGADYALFLTTHDAYGSSGRKTAQIFGAMFGVAIVPGVHIGYAGLVDLKTGDVIWFNADPQMGGDVRTPEGAAKRVQQLLDGLPGRAVSVGSVAK
ncbi:hypothetical protein DBR17_10675 [Sphingomonas sp. HMWF008]|nr:hypothetical protein DBR17_10675 [Sphingomonas sp. HMWF008]